ncbi:OmpA family protein [Massilia niastensis]|uniref:OmpA family protein n=1 Tax=Massilia niastensis TaxID=544911 RepID=UPI00036C083F|nr:OmpA family protein [Massilia niastensis]
MKTSRTLLYAALLGAAAQAQAVGFVACPVYRDTDAGRKSGCWLANDGARGVRYDVTESASKPVVGRMVLVEGEVAGARDICGGVVLNPVRVAVLEQPCPEVVVPAEGFPSKPSVLPAEFLQPLGVPRKLPEAPFSPQTYQIGFSFNDDRLIYQSVETTIERAMLYAVASKARKVRVTGYADVRGFRVSGRKLAEPKALARARAEMVTLALVRLGVPEASIETRWRTDPQPIESPPSLANASKRRVTVQVEP